jgi:hypothetical protein
MFFLSAPEIDRPEGEEGKQCKRMLTAVPMWTKNAAWMRHLVGR